MFRYFLPIAFMLFSAPAVAVECSPNMTWDVWKEKMGDGEPSPLTDSSRRQFLSAFNSFPPISAYNPEDVYLFVNMGTIIVFFVTDSCVTLINKIPLEVVSKWMDGEDA